MHCSIGWTPTLDHAVENYAGSHLARDLYKRYDYRPDKSRSATSVAPLARSWAGPFNLFLELNRSATAVVWHSNAGDLRHFFQGYFDTTNGSKCEAASYLAIAKCLDRPPGAILFLSDAEAGLDAARLAG